MIPVQHNLPRVQLDMSNAMMEIQARGNECLVCGKRFDLFRSMLLPHYCGHFYKEIAQGHEEYFTAENCKLCGARATKRKSRIIHLGVKHELVLPYIQEILKARGLGGEAVGQLDVEEAEEKALVVKEEKMEDEEDEETPDYRIVTPPMKVKEERLEAASREEQALEEEMKQKDLL